METKTKLPRILIITGIHGNEERNKQILNHFLANYQVPLNEICEIMGFDMNTGFKTRDVSFNLNRMDQVQQLTEIKERMDYLKECIDRADIVIDLHNSPICSNKLLVTTKSIDTLPDWYTYSESYQDMIIWRLSNFESLSEYARKLGKIAFTAEFGGMVSNEIEPSPNDILFLRYSLDLCLDLFEQREFKKNDSILNFKLFTEFNQLIEIKLQSKTFLYPGQIIPGSTIESINSKTEVNHIDKPIENYNYEVISPESNYDYIFDGITKKIKGIK